MGLPFHERAHGFEVRRIRSFRKRPGGCSIPEMFAFVALASFHAIFECLRFRPDLVHIHHAVPDGPIGLWLKLLLGKPYAITAHGGDIPGHMPSLDGLFRRIHPVMNAVWGKAAANVVVADHLLPLARKSYPRSRLLCIPNGVDTERFHPPLSRVENTEVRILYAGRFHIDKNIAFLLRALPRVAELAARPFRVVLYGSGQEQESLLRLTRELGIERLVEFPGWIDREGIIKAFRQGDVFCLPSLVEGMPISCIQAMACGLPVVATDIPGNRTEVIPDETGLLVPVNDTDALAGALARLINLPEQRQAMGDAGRARCERQFSWSVIGKQYEDLFQEILSETPVS